MQLEQQWSSKRTFATLHIKTENRQHLPISNEKVWFTFDLNMFLDLPKLQRQRRAPGNREPDTTTS